jgi:manganese/zinc/iron transport system substrate-binding protein
VDGKGEFVRTPISVTFLAAVMVLTSCGGSPRMDDVGGVKVVATTNIVADLVRTVGGPEVEVEALMGPGIDPHLYKASAGDVRRMSSAEAIFYSGHHLEGKMSEVLESIGEQGVLTVAVAECVPEADLIESEDYSGLSDPHVWFDVALWSHTVGCVSETLAALDPDRSDGYRERASAYAETLRQLDAWVKEQAEVLAPEQRVLITAHDAFGYFGRAYDFEVRGLLGVSTASEASTSDVQELAEFIVERRIPAIFVETSVPPRYVQALQEAVRARGFEVEIGGSLYSDSLGDVGTTAGSYEGTVRANVKAIVTALAAGPTSE